MKVAIALRCRAPGTRSSRCSRRRCRRATWASRPPWAPPSCPTSSPTRPSPPSPAAPATPRTWRSCPIATSSTTTSTPTWCALPEGQCCARSTQQGCAEYHRSLLGGACQADELPCESSGWSVCVLQHAMSFLCCSASPALPCLAHLICTLYLQDVLDDRNQIPRSEVGLPDDKIVYSCSNQLYKVRIPCARRA